MKKIAVIMLIAGMLGGCGTAMGDRGLSGAAVGAGIGVLGGPPGIVVGGVVGAGVGMLSKPNQINLGKPFWRG